MNSRPVMINTEMATIHIGAGRDCIMPQACGQ